MVNTNLFSQAKTRLTTIRDLLRFAVSMFRQHNLYYGHGTTNAYDEAIYLILHTLNLPLDQLEPYLDATLLEEEIKHVLNILQQRVVDRIPAPYLTHQAIFHGYSFYVDSRVIIPRSFIAEILLADSLNAWIPHPELVHNVLDLGTGNGSLAIIAAEYFYDSNIIASDINLNALEVAQINVNDYGLEDRIRLIQSDLFTNLTVYQGKFDLIVTNPPYVDKKRMQQLPAEYLHEPNVALTGGDNGLKFINAILTQAYNYLTEYGILVVEMGDNREELEALYPHLPFTWLATQSNEGFVFVLAKKDLVNL